jgi:hypothetical protein
MTRVRIRGGYLNIGRRQRPGTGPVDPDYGVDEGDVGGEGPEVEPPEIEPPPGIWPPPTIGHPVHPIAPGDPNKPGHLPSPPPGAIWPPVDSPVEGLFIVLAHIPDHGWKYIVIDPDAWERPDIEPPAGGIGGRPPQRPGPGVPPAEPKR